MVTLETIRARAVKFMAMFIAIHVPLILAIGLALDTHITAPVIGALVTALICGAAAWQAPHQAATRMLLSVGIMVMVSLIVYQFEGHPWQIDAHFYYFACLASLATLCDIRAVITATIAIAVHHLGLNFTFPAWIFPDGADFGRFLIHAVIVIVEAVTISWLVSSTIDNIAALNAVAREAEDAKSEAERLGQGQIEQSRLLAGQKARDMETLAQSFSQSVGPIATTVSNSALELAENAGDMIQLQALGELIASCKSKHRIRR